MLDNPYQSPDGKLPPPKKSPLWFLGRLMIYAAIIALVIALLLPLTRGGGTGAREAARRNQCLNNLKQIGLALMNYEDIHGTFPPAYTVDADGNRLHSWRTLLLPYIEQQQLYDQIDLAKAWDDPANAAARETLVECYTCPSGPFELGDTNYLAVVGPECMFTGTDGRSIAEATDGTSTTIYLAEGPTDRTVHWMSPQDTNLEVVLAMDAESRTGHPGGFMAAYLDGHVDFIDFQIDREKLRGMLTIAGGEELAE